MIQSKTKKACYITAIMIFAVQLAVGQETTDAKINWMSWDAMVEANKKAPKKVFIDVYTWWCGWCKRMDAATFTDQRIIKEMNQNFYAVKMDAEMKDTIVFNDHTFINPMPGTRRSTHQLASSLLDNKLSYPSFVVLDEKFQRLNILKGYKDADFLDNYLKFFSSGEYLKRLQQQNQQQGGQQPKSNKAQN